MSRRRPWSSISRGSTFSRFSISSTLCYLIHDICYLQSMFPTPTLPYYSSSPSTSSVQLVYSPSHPESAQIHFDHSIINASFTHNTRSTICIVPITPCLAECSLRHPMFQIHVARIGSDDHNAFIHMI